MDKIVTYGFGEHFIERLADLIHREFYPHTKNFGVGMHRVACVFGGQRPALFLKKALARRIGGSFIPPRIFSMDSFMEYLLNRDTPLPKISELDACYQIYKIVRQAAPGFLNSGKSFNDFLPWAAEIVSFIEQLDIEKISDKSLECVGKNAEIGYDVPENINKMLRHIAGIRQKYHQELAKRKIYSRGSIYLEASNRIQKQTPGPAEGFDQIIFCNFFYLHETEKTIVREIVRKNKGICVFQGDQNQWPVLKSNAKLLGHPIEPVCPPQADTGEPNTKSSPRPQVEMHHGPDLHAQVCLVREILKNIKEKEDTVIVVPNPEAIIPLISEVASELKEFNISMGYFLNRSPLAALFKLLAKLQESRQDAKYYTKDYLNLLRHPLVKNLKISGDFSITRVIIHKLEESLKGVKGAETAVTGNIFLSPAEIEKDEALHKSAADTLANMGLKVSTDDCAGILKTLHQMLLHDWNGITTFGCFGKTLALFLDMLADKSMVGAYSFNIKVMEKLYGLAAEMEQCFFRNEAFNPDDIWHIFRRRLENGMVSFSGSPLRGTQILGLLETRSLNFKNVIVMDANESVLPRLKLHESLIPREVMLSLGLNRLANEEEIQKYYFRRLISGARNVWLVYEENREKEKSRFLEEIIWEEEKQKGRLDIIKPRQAAFRMQPKVQEQEISKTPEMIKYLREQTYSASRLNRYLECPLSFYYRYVLGLEEPENALEDPDAALIGTFFHELLEEGFQRFIKKKPFIDEVFEKYLAEEMDQKFEAELKPRMKSDWFLLKAVMDARLKEFLKHERKRSEKINRIIELESDSTEAIMFKSGRTNFNYRVDRIDELQDGTFLVLDYKTGGLDNTLKPKSYKKLGEMEFTRKSILKSIGSFQLPLYNYFINKKYSGQKVNAALYSLRDFKQAVFISEKDSDNEREIMEICLKGVEYILGEIFDLKAPFSPDKEDERRCSYCPFAGLCG